MPRASRYKPFHDRVNRALSQHIRLLHRSGATFYILGDTGNVYTVTISTVPKCSCPDPVTPCKHLLFVYLQVLGYSERVRFIRGDSFSMGEVEEMLRCETLPGSMAGESVWMWFHQMYDLDSQQRRQQQGTSSSSSTMKPRVVIEEGASCPICLDEMGKQDKVVACGTCRKPVHEACFLKWKTSAGTRPAHCVMCRAKWGSIEQEELKYLNLSAYDSSCEDDDDEDEDEYICEGCLHSD